MPSRTPTEDLLARPARTISVDGWPQVFFWRLSKSFDGIVISPS